MDEVAGREAGIREPDRADDAALDELRLPCRRQHDGDGELAVGVAGGGEGEGELLAAVAGIGGERQGHLEGAVVAGGEQALGAPEEFAGFVVDMGGEAGGGLVAVADLDREERGAGGGGVNGLGGVEEGFGGGDLAQRVVGETGFEVDRETRDADEGGFDRSDEDSCVARRSGRSAELGAGERRSGYVGVVVAVAVCDARLAGSR